MDKNVETKVFPHLFMYIHSEISLKTNRYHKKALKVYPLPQHVLNIARI
jgi:hypothetical protein